MKDEYVNKVTKIILSFLVYFYTSIILVPIFKNVIKLDFTNNYATSFLIYDLVNQLIVGTVVIILYISVLKIDGKKTKEKVKESGIFRFFKTIVLGYVLCVLSGIFASYVESFISIIFNVKLSISNNQNIVETLLKEVPILMIVSSCIMAPVIEELIFRCGIRQVIKDKRVFITVSGLIFGLMHVTDNVILIIEILTIGIVLNLILEGNRRDKISLSVASILSILLIYTGIYFLIYGNLINVIVALDPKEIIVSISYIIMGSILSMIYTKYDNIILNILVHAFNNTVSTILILSLL